MRAQRFTVSLTRYLIGIAFVPLLLGACSGKDPDQLLASAKTYLAKNDRKAAIIQIKNALQANPELAEARYLLGTALLGEGNVTLAEVELRKAQRAGYQPDLVVPKLAAAMLAMGQGRRLIDEFDGTKLTAAAAKAELATVMAGAYAGLGEMDKAEASIAEALLADPTYPRALLFRARALAVQKDFEGARTIADRMVLAAPQDPEGWKLKGDIALAKASDSAAALESYRKSVAVRSDYIPGHLAIADLLMRERKLDESQTQLDMATKIAPNDLQVRYAKALVASLRQDWKVANTELAVLVKALPDRANVLLLAGGAALEQGSFGQATVHLSHALEVAPENMGARQLLMKAYLRAGQPARALDVFKKGQANKEADPSLFALAGEAYLRTGDAKNAEELLAKAAKLDPKDPRKRTAVAVARLDGGNIDAAVSDLQKISASDAGTSADLALISAYTKNLQLDKAMKAVDGLEKKQPGQPLAPFLRGQVQTAAADVAGARISFERALSLAPSFFPAVASLSALDVSQRKFAEAKARLTQFVTVEPKNVRALLTLAEVEGRSGASTEQLATTIGKAIAANSSDPAPRLMLVDTYLKAKNSQRAMAVAQEGLTALPDNADLLSALGQAQLAAGEANRAVGNFAKAVEVQGDSPTRYLRLAAAQRAASAPAQAEQSLSRALKLDPNMLDAQIALFGLYIDAGNVDGALQLSRAIKAQRPKQSVGYVLEGGVDSYKKDLPSAISVYRAGLSAAPSSELAVKLHDLLSVAGQRAEAEKFAAEWQKKNAADTGFSFYLGDLALRRKDYPAAQAHYQAVLKSDPDNAPALNNLAWLSNELHQAGALELSEKANKLAPDQPVFMDTLALILADAKRYDEALKTQQRAMALQPQNPDLRLGLAKLYIKAGDKESARSRLNELAALGSKFSSQNEVKTILQSL